MDSLYQQALRYRPWEICLLPPRTCPLASMWTERLASLPISIKDMPHWLTSHRDLPSQVDLSIRWMPGPNYLRDLFAHRAMERQVSRALAQLGPGQIPRLYRQGPKGD